MGGVWGSTIWVIDNSNEMLVHTMALFRVWCRRAWGFVIRVDDNSNTMWSLIMDFSWLQCSGSWYFVIKAIYSLDRAWGPIVGSKLFYYGIEVALKSQNQSHREGIWGLWFSQKWEKDSWERVSERMVLV